MASIMIATRTKQYPHSKIGVSFRLLGSGKTIISRVDEYGLFGGSTIQEGQEVLRINDNPVRGKSIQEVAAILRSLSGEITLQTGPGTQSCVLTCSVEAGERLSFNNQQRQNVPSFLAFKGVSHAKWTRLVNSFTNQLMPAVQQALSADEVFQKEMSVYIDKQRHKTDYYEEKHERKVFMMTHQAAVLHSNLTLVANNVIAVANALLNGNGVLAELKFTERQLPNYSVKQVRSNIIKIPTAIQFTPIEDYGETVPNSVPPIATAVACVALDDDDDDDTSC